MATQSILSAFAMKDLPNQVSFMIMEYVIGDKNHWKTAFDAVLGELFIKTKYLQIDNDILMTIADMPLFLRGHRHITYSRTRPPTILYEMKWQHGIGPRTLLLHFQNGAWGIETYRFFYNHRSEHIRPMRDDEYGRDDRAIIHYDYDAFWTDVKAEMALRMS
jgi:hypothetical protein